VGFLPAQRAAAPAAGAATLLAVHHPPITGSTNHIPSPGLLADIDAACAAAKFWPHAILSGHAHNHQRYTRTIPAAVNGGAADFDMPLIVSGVGGHGLVAMRPASAGTPIRPPLTIQPGAILEYYFDSDYGFLRIVVDAATLRLEFHQAGIPNTKAPNDVVTVDLAAHQMISN
jgi:hypothetical protein